MSFGSLVRLSSIGFAITGCNALSGIDAYKTGPVIVPDAPVDVGPGPDSPVADGEASVPPKGCTKIDAELCDDFDDGDLTAGPWTSRSAVVGAAFLDVSDAQSLTPPFALRAESTDGDGGVLGVLSKEWPSFSGNLFLSFDLYVADPPSSGMYLVKCQLTEGSHVENDSADPHLALFPGADGTKITAFNLKGFAPGEGAVFGQIPTGKWAHVEVTRRTAGAKTALAFTVDGKKLEREVSAGVPLPKPYVLLGLESGDARFKVFFDNVVMDTR